MGFLLAGVSTVSPIQSGRVRIQCWGLTWKWAGLEVTSAGLAVTSEKAAPVAVEEVAKVCTQKNRPQATVYCTGETRQITSPLRFSGGAGCETSRSPW